MEINPVDKSHRNDLRPNQTSIVKMRRNRPMNKNFNQSNHILFITLAVILLSAALCLLIQNTAFGQFRLGAEIRPRTEFRHGYSDLAAPSSQTAIFTSQRSRLSFLYKQEKIRLGISLQDIRVWGDEVQLGDFASAAVHESWGEFDLSPKLSLKFGRQEMIYDDHRLMGNVGWVQQARSHDAALLKFRQNGWKVDFAAAYNSERQDIFRTRFTLNNYRSLFLIWINKSFDNGFQISFPAIADGFQAADPNTNDVIYRYTFGPHVQLKFNPMQLTGTFYYQSGHNQNNADISAFLFAIKGRYQSGNVSITGWVDYLSGTDGLKTNNSEINTFNTLYATNHKFYGFMDYFLNIPVHTANGGLVDAYVNLSYQFPNHTTAALTYHNFSFAKDVADRNNPGRAIDRSLGSEIDFVLTYQFLPEVNLSGGFSKMFPGSSMEYLKGGDKDTSQNWTWFMITIKTNLFSDKSN